MINYSQDTQALRWMLHQLKIAKSDISKAQSSGLGDALSKVCVRSVKDDLQASDE